MTRRLQIRVRGQVQGVGFRPHVHAQALRFGVTGWVRNDTEGVLIEGQGEGVAAFVEALTALAPPLARIDAVESVERPVLAGESGFVIHASDASGVVATGVVADAAVCPACLAELFDPADRRHRYAFLNCTHCGPRFTITRRLPYDRPQTALAGFPLCPACAAEYDDPTDRRFHAQPTACPDCGPRLSCPPEVILDHLRAGRIVALKGLGGFHLVCDATRADIVERLRRVKQRNGKPFALMVANAASAARFVALSGEERALLTGHARPILLARRRADGPALAPGVAPDLAWLGVMLPYTPLHHLLFHEAAGRPAGTGWMEEPQDLALVMTSANPGGEPLVIDNDEARARLGGIADVIVDHNRPIIVRADDLVARWLAGAPPCCAGGAGGFPNRSGWPIRFRRFWRSAAI